VIRVRAASTADVDAIVALEAIAFPLDPWSAGLVGDGVAGRTPTAWFLVAEEGEELAGYAVVSSVDDVAELQRIAVPSDRRRRGVGSALLARVRDGATERGAARLLLEVRDDNGEARAFYARHGFAEIARRRRYYRDGTDAVVLEAGLEEERDAGG
jgi:ribosomal-protein-alanine N-acetyltransferase